MSIWDAMKDAWKSEQDKLKQSQEFVDTEAMPIVDAEGVVVEEEVQEEPVASTNETIRMTARQESSFHFPKDATDVTKMAIVVIGSMPEQTVEQQTAKALEWKYYSNPSVRDSLNMSGVESMNQVELGKRLSELHQYDADGGAAWYEEHADWLQLTDESVACTTNMVECGLNPQLRQSMTMDEASAEQVQQVLDGTAPEWGLVTVERKDVVQAVAEDAWEDGYSDAFGGTRILQDNGMVSYRGTLGEFAYDPSEFQLQVIHVDADEFGNPETSYPILKYIGDEVDGKQVHIPEGLKDASFMFEGNKDLESMPKLPSSLETAFGMFKDCENLRNAGAAMLPLKLKETQFMFANCTNMTVGPHVVNVKDATGMFANCPNLLNTPTLASGLECADSMFAGCESLDKKPKFPRSVKFADYATAGCTGIDEAEKNREKQAMEKAQMRFEKQQHKQSLGDHLGRVFSACMQVHAMTKSGHNIMHALLLTKSLRQTGVLARDMAGGWEAMYKANRSGFNQYMMVTSRQNVQKRQAKNQERYQANADAFQATHTARKESSKADRVMYANGYRAMKAHFFEKVNQQGFAASGMSYMAVKADAEELRNVIQFRQEYGGLDAKSKSVYAKKAVELVSNQVAYYKGADAALQSRQSGITDKTAAKNGLETMCRNNMGELMAGIRDAQQTSQFLNERQLATIFEMMEQTPYGKTEAYATVRQQMVSDMRNRAQFTKAEQDATMNSHRRQSRMRTEDGPMPAGPQAAAKSQPSHREAPDIVKEPSTLQLEEGMSF